MPIPIEISARFRARLRCRTGSANNSAGKMTHDELKREQDAACRDSIERMEAAGALKF